MDQIIDEYTDFITSNIAYNMMIALVEHEDIEVFQKLSSIDMNESIFKFEIEVEGKLKGVSIPFGKLPLTCSTLDEAIQQEKEFRSTIETLIEHHSGIVTVEKSNLEESKKQTKKANLKIIK